MPVEQCDRDVANAIAVSLMGDFAKRQYSPSILSGAHDNFAHVQIVAAHREAAEQRGREAERAEIVAWLEAQELLYGPDKDANACDFAEGFALAREGIMRREYK